LGNYFSRVFSPGSFMVETGSLCPFLLLSMGLTLNCTDAVDSNLWKYECAQI